MLKLARFKESIASIANVENVETVGEKITFNTITEFDGRILSIKACVSFNYDYSYKVTSSVLNGSNTNDRKFAKKIVAFLVEKSFKAKGEYSK